MPLEEMGAFFNARAEGYEDHMMDNVDGASEYYRFTAEQVIHEGPFNLLDLGCGTGLELDEIVSINPEVRFTGIDLAKDMTDRLLKKHHRIKERIRIINEDYSKADFGVASYDVAMSVQTLHHFTHTQKTAIYKKIYQALKDDGYYVETDYMAPDQAFEDKYFAEYEQLKADQGITDGWFHFDTPCTYENQKKMLLDAGFKKVEKKWQKSCTILLVAYK